MWCNTKFPPQDHVWSPINGPSIILWKANPNGSPKLPTGVPSLILYHPIWGNDASSLMERKKLIRFGLSKYVDFEKVGIAQSSTYEVKMKPYVEYWKDILLHLSKPLPPQSTTLLEGFWPSSDWRFNYVRIHCQPWLTLLTYKFQFKFLIVDQRTWNL